MKTYLRYIPTKTFGIIASTQCNDVLLDPKDKLAITANVQDVGVFNLRQANKVMDVVMVTGRGQGMHCWPVVESLYACVWL